MAEYSTRLKCRSGSGVVDVKIYSTPADIPPWQRPMRVRLSNGLDGWVPTSPLGSPDASPLRVRHPGSSAVYVVNTIGRAVYGSLALFGPGNAGFTVPTGVRRLKVHVVSGGSSASMGKGNYAGRVGGGSSFGGIVVTGDTPAPSGDGPKWPTAQNGYFDWLGAHGDPSYGSGRVFWPGVGFGAPGIGNMYCKNGFLGQYVVQTISVYPGQYIGAWIGYGGAGYSLVEWGSSEDGPYSNTYSVGRAAHGGIVLEWGGNIE